MRRVVFGSLISACAVACGGDDDFPQLTTHTVTGPSQTSAASGDETDDGGDGSGSSTAPGDSDEGTSGNPTTDGDGSSGGVPPAWACGDLPIAAQPHGQVYTDADGSDQGRYSGGFEMGTDTPRPNTQIQLLGSTEAPVLTCDDGRYQFEADDGTYLVVAPPTPSDCSQRNCVRRLPEALDQGMVKIVTIGDSVASFGGAPPFPARVAELLSAVNGAAITQENLANFDARSVSWVPGAALFEAARPSLTDADVVVISLGARDLQDFAENINLMDLGAIPAQAEAMVNAVASNGRAIAAEVHAINPTADVVFCLYPDYSAATQTTPWNALALIPAGIIADLFGGVREQLTPADDIVVVDLLGLTSQLSFPLDDVLADGIHFNDTGHDLYAHEVFRALGGVIVGPSPLANDPPSNNRQDFGYVP